MIQLDDPLTTSCDARPRTQSTSPSPSSIRGSVHEIDRRVPTLTNSPGCVPSPPEARVPEPSRPSSQGPDVDAPGRPAATGIARPPRRVGPVRVDAWAVPAATRWGRTRATVRKVSRSPGTIDSALPF
jgi:hypothetical protein